MLFHDSTFTAEQDRYIQVNILLSLCMYNYSVWLKQIVNLLSEYPDPNTFWIVYSDIIKCKRYAQTA